MIKKLPNKWIRKAVFEALDGLVVNGETIQIFDTRVSGYYEPDHFIILSTQTTNVIKNNMCEDFWDTTINLDIMTSYPKGGNPGSRLLCNDITDEVRELTQDIQLDAQSGLKVMFQTFTAPTEIFLETESENIFRSIVTISLEIQ